MSDNQDTYPNAGRDSGYVAPVGEDLVNALTVLLAQLETKLLTSNMALKSEIGKQGDIRREQIRELTDLVDRRHDGLAGELDKLIAATEESGRRLGKSEADIEALQVVTAAHAQRLDEQDDRHAALLHGAIARIAVLEADRSRFDALQAGFADLAARIGGALPTEADQDLSAQLRVDEAERARPSDGS